MNNIQKAAIETIETFIKMKGEYNSVNDKLKKISPDFPTRINAIDDKIELSVVKLLDVILGNADLASYFIYECQDMKNGGSIYCNSTNKEYKLKSISDLVKYIESDLYKSAA